MSSIEHVSGAAFQDAVKQGTVLVDFFATWCGPCKKQSQILESMVSDDSVPQGVRILKVDIDEEPELASSMGIEVVPTLFIFKDGKKVTSFTGVRLAEQLVEDLR